MIGLRFDVFFRFGAHALLDHFDVEGEQFLKKFFVFENRLHLGIGDQRGEVFFLKILKQFFVGQNLLDGLFLHEGLVFVERLDFFKLSRRLERGEDFFHVQRTRGGQMSDPLVDDGVSTGLKDLSADIVQPFFVQGKDHHKNKGHEKIEAAP